MKSCIICGRMTNTEHHLLFGHGIRNLCDKDRNAGIVVPMCDACHTLGMYKLHDNPVAEHLSKMAGQALWERWYLTAYGDATELDQYARDMFIDRYGRSYL